MPRVARGLADGMIYHVINRGNGRREVFHKEVDFQAFISLLKEAKEKHPVQLLGYYLMSNHFNRQTVLTQRRNDATRIIRLNAARLKTL